jgi:D-glutamate cyclase
MSQTILRVGQTVVLRRAGTLFCERNGINMDEILLNIGENLDQLSSLTIQPQGTDQAVVRRLYSAARAKFGQPLTILAAERLNAALGAGKSVILATGGGFEDYLPVGETDGPLGAAALAATLAVGIGAVPILVTEAQHVDNIAATALAAGLGIRDFEVARRVPGTCAVVPFPSDENASNVAEEYFRRFQPKALVAIEKLGPNSVGVAHTATGMAASPSRARVEALFDLAAARGILTLGVGDNGNELGCGVIQEAVRKHKQYGSVCRCPCGRGIACQVSADVLVIAGTSNWGAYGIASAVAAMLGNPGLLHSPEVERRMLEECVRTGAADASLGRHVPSVDGTPPAVQIALLELMRSVISIGLMVPRKRGF